MLKILSGFILSLLFLTTGIILGKENEPVVLKYNFIVGQTREYKVKEYVNMDLAGVQALAQTEYTSVEKTVNRDEDDRSEMSVMMSDINESYLIGSRLIAMQVLAELEERPFEFSVTSQGDLNEFGPPSLKGIPFELRPTLELLARGLEGTYTLLTPQMPDQPVKVGDSWQTKRNVRINHEVLDYESVIEITDTYKIKKNKKSKGHQCFEIEGISQLTSQDVQIIGDVIVKAESTGELKAKWLFDYERGLTQKYEFKGTLESVAQYAMEEDQKSMKTKMMVFKKTEWKKIK